VKQADVNRLLSSALKESARAHHWNYSRGFLFKSSELLIFRIIVTANSKRRDLCYLLDYKPLAFDDLFWKIVKIEENLKRPLSFRVAGAWTSPMMMISEGKQPVFDWDRECPDDAVNEIIYQCEHEAENLSQEIHELDDNLRVMERLSDHRKETFPNADTTIWHQRLLTAILMGKYLHAERIVRNRIENHDMGGFQLGTKSFYQLAYDFLKSVA
jgi:hypothetical protein